MINAIASPSHSRATPSAGTNAGAVAVAGASFALLLVSDDATPNDPAGATLDEGPTADRQDDAAAGKPLPTTDADPSLLAADPSLPGSDAAWLMSVLAGQLPISSSAPVDPPAELPGGAAAPSGRAATVSLKLPATSLVDPAPRPSIVPSAAPSPVIADLPDEDRKTPAASPDRPTAKPPAAAAIPMLAVQAAVVQPALPAERPAMTPWTPSLQAQVRAALPDTANVNPLPTKTMDASPPTQAMPMPTLAFAAAASPTLSFTAPPMLAGSTVINAGSGPVVSTVVSRVTVVPAADAAAPVSAPPIMVPAPVTEAIVPTPLATGFVRFAATPAVIASPGQNPTDPPLAYKAPTVLAPSVTPVPLPESSPVLTPAQTSVPVATTSPVSKVAPAGQVFAAAIHDAARKPPGDDAIVLQAMSAIATHASTPGVVAAAGGRSDAALDLRHPGWPSAMIDHIEKLRDAADASDTRIRLVPDALGGIDVSLRRHDEGVRVTLSADQPATQALLADARPQLTELAQARGIRLADAPVGTGGQSLSDGLRQPFARPATPGAPASATTTTDDDDLADGRVA